MQDQQGTVPVLSGDPFRVFAFGSRVGLLRSVGLDLAGLGGELGAGLDVLRVEPPEGRTLGRVIGLIARGRLRVVLAFEPDPAAPADWSLRGLDRADPGTTRLARLVATWSPYSSRQGRTISPGTRSRPCGSAGQRSLITEPGSEVPASANRPTGRGSQPGGRVGTSRGDSSGSG
ncbi:MAG: hypothetical protein JWO38_4145 [Gemmataceae bacterium]|nr:hypothetical protein [Gemmataceae bacterium]